MTKTFIRTLFGVIVFFLVLEFLLAKVTRQEPYPAMIFPGFGEIPENGEVVTSTLYELKISGDKGDSELLDHTYIFNYLPAHYHQVVLKRIFEKANAGRKEGIEDFRNLIKNKLIAVNKTDAYSVSVVKLKVVVNALKSSKDVKVVEEKPLFSL